MSHKYLITDTGDRVRRDGRPWCDLASPNAAHLTDIERCQARRLYRDERANGADRLTAAVAVRTYVMARPTDPVNVADALERHLATIERLATVYGPSGEVSAKRERGAIVQSSDGPTYAPRHAIKSDGTVGRRHATSIVGMVRPSRMVDDEVPYVVGRSDDAPTFPTFGECADVGAFGRIIEHRTMTAIERGDRLDTIVTNRRTMARTTAIDMLADVWARQHGIELEPVIGLETIAAHAVMSLDDGATDEYGNRRDRSDVPAWRNVTQADTARTLYGHGPRRIRMTSRGYGSPRQFRAFDVRDVSEVFDDRGANPDKRRLRWGLVPVRPRMPLGRTLASAAERMNLTAVPRLRLSDGKPETYTARDGSVRQRMQYVRFVDGRTVYASPDYHHATTMPDGSIVRTVRVERREVVSVSKPSAPTTRAGRRARSAAVAIEREETAIELGHLVTQLDAIPNGGKATVGTIDVSRSAKDGRWIVKRRPFRTALGAAAHVARLSEVTPTP